MGSTEIGTTKNLSNDVIDFSGMIGGSDFPESAGSATEVALFFLVTNAPKGIRRATTVQGVIDSYPEGDLLIAFLRIAK